MENGGGRKHTCAVCKEPGEKFCGGCKSVHYCSVEHQKSDWKTHKAVCPPYIVDDDPVMGQQWIATRNIKAGTILLDEPPALFGPQWTEPSFQTGTPNCITCGRYMTQNGGRRCPSCGWPVCGTECAKMAVHAENECRTFATRKIPFPPTNFDFPPSDLCLCITWLRGAGLKGQNEEGFEGVMGLQHYFVDTEYNKALDEAAEEVVRKLKILIGPQLDAPAEDYKRIARAKKVNAFGGCLYPNIVDTFTNDSVPNSNLFVKASRANHSCVPNCSWSVGGLLPPNLRIRIRSAIDIKKGDCITISYRPSDIQLGTSERQMALRNGYGFICKCPRCTDPTECDTFVSGIKCQTCLNNVGGKTKDKTTLGENSGYFLPLDPLNLDPDSVWSCNSCGEEKLTKIMVPFVSFLEEQFKRLKASFDFSDHGLEKRAPIYEKFVQDNKMKLHPNHWIFQKVTMEIIVCHRKLKNLMSRQELEGSIKYFEYRLNIQNKTMPGLSAERAMTLRYLKDVLLTLLARFNSMMTANEIRHWAQYCNTVLVEALNFYKNDINPQHLMQKSKPITEKLMEDIKNLEKNVNVSLYMCALKSNNG